MIQLKTPSEIAVMKKAGRIASIVLQQVLEGAKVGVSLKQLDTLAESLIQKNGASPSFKMEKGYRWATCMCPTDVVVHGIPTDQKLEPGDKLCVDLGVFQDGFHADTAWTVQIENKQSLRSSQVAGLGELRMENDKLPKFLDTGKVALDKAIAQCRVGNYIGDISRTIQEVVEGAGYSCVRQLVGHGVGKMLHEDPEVPCYVRGRVENTPELQEGMTLAIEVIYNLGKSPVVYKNTDGWTIVTADGSPSAVFEHSVAITADGPEVLTAWNQG